MLDAAFIHRKHARNVGDQSCSPGTYFDFGDQARFDFEDDVPASKLAILGGGQTFQQCVSSVIFKTPQARQRVVWGVGISPKDRASIEYDLLEGSCALVSTRNWGIDECEYVPCVSAMSDLFNAAPAPDCDVVMFTHAYKSRGLERVEGVPEASNRTGTMADAVRFLARGETVVTNSYHGTYWAMCLGRRVLCLPFNRKFRFFRDNPVMAQPEDWKSMLGRAEMREGVLENARERNRDFYEKVRNL